MLSTALREKQNPLLRDFEEENLKYGGVVDPHPDGRAWRKACEECAGRKSDPQDLGDKYQADCMKGRPDSHFYCIHRDDGGQHRICACYAALNAL